MTPETEAFLILLRAGLWETGVPAAAPFPLSPSAWEQVYQMARQQTVTGWVYQGIAQLPDNLMPPDRILMRWVAAVDAIERESRRMNAALCSMLRWMADRQLNPVVLKGQGLAVLYAQPLLRECGDIDLYFTDEADYTRALSELREQRIPVTRHADASVSWKWQGVEVELHTQLFDLQSRGVQPLLQQLQQTEGWMEQTLTASQTTVSMCVPAPAVNYVLLSSHILKHALGWGIGLRQICDLAVFCQHTACESLLVQSVCQQAGIEAWTRLLHAFLVDYLGVAPQRLPFNHVPADSRPLLKRVLRDGNFGCSHRAEPAGSAVASKWQTACRFLANFRFAWRYAPREAISLFFHLAKGQSSC